MRHLKMYEKYLTNNDNIVEYLNSKLDKYIIDVHFSEIDIYEDIKNTTWWNWRLDTFTWQQLIDFINNIPKGDMKTRKDYINVYNEFVDIVNSEEFKTIIESEELGLI